MPKPKPSSARSKPMSTSTWKGAPWTITVCRVFPKPVLTPLIRLVRLNLSDEKMPVNVKIKAFNPLIPGDAERSGIPLAALTYEVTNTSNQPLTVSVAGSMRNFVGKDGSKGSKSWKGEFNPSGAKQNKNQFRQGKTSQGIFMYSDGVDKADPAWGTIALSTNALGDVSYAPFRIQRLGKCVAGFLG